MPIVKCGICAKDFYVKPSHLSYGWGKYCSTECRSKAQFKGKRINCSTCGKEIFRTPRLINRSKSGKLFCSKSCQTCWRNNYYSGENSTNWVNGENAYRKILKRSGKPQICELCKTLDERILNAHHIDHERTNNRIENLVWLCLNCHFLVHHYPEVERKINNGGVCRTV